MIVLSNSQTQTLAPGQSMIFDIEVLKVKECGCCHRKNSPSVKITKKGIHRVSFSGNIGAGTTGAALLVINAGGEPLPETYMQSTTAAAGDFNNVATTTLLNVCCGDYSRITVSNPTNSNVRVGANSALVIE